MKKTDRIPRILDKLRVYWEQYPDLRLCQILDTAAHMQGWPTTNIFNVEDELIENWLNQRTEGLP